MESTLSPAAGPYTYISQLQALESQAPSTASPLREVQGFLPLQPWLPFLHLMADQHLASFLKREIQYSFAIGFDCSSPLQSAPTNMSSVQEHPEIVSQYIAVEVAAGRLRPVPAKLLSPIGLIPKKNRADAFRMIVDLSSPEGQSVNDRIASKACSFYYSSVADAALTAKLDLKTAYQMVPVHPEDSPLLGIQWNGESYID